MSPATIIIEPEAKLNIRAVRDYYSENSESAASRFLDELDSLLELLSHHPESAAIAFGQTRLKPMRDFPYVIGYVYDVHVVHVTGVMHGGLGWEEFHRRQS